MLDFVSKKRFTTGEKRQKLIFQTDSLACGYDLETERGRAGSMVVPLVVVDAAWGARAGG